MSNTQISSTTSSITDDSMEILFQIIHEDTFYPFNINPKTNQYDELAEEQIKKIIEDLRTVDNPTDEHSMLILYLDETMDLELDSPRSKSSVNPVNSLDSPSASINSQSFDDEDEEPFDPKEWMVYDVLLFKTRPPKLKEYLCLLLNNPRYHSYACWVNKNEGLFKIHKPAQVVILWEKVKLRKTKRTMDFDSFARGIRCYYKSGFMIKTHTKHTYRFA
jgi:hypothetical protein